MTVMFSVLFGLFSIYYLLILSEKKNVENIKVLAVSYSSENDPEAEHLLLDIWPAFSSDTTLKSLLSNELTGQELDDKIFTQLHETYFGGYWGNFKLNIVTCRNDDPLSIGSENKWLKAALIFLMNVSGRRVISLREQIFIFLKIREEDHVM